MINKRINSFTENIIASRKLLVADLPVAHRQITQEGGCGVVGFATSVPVCGRHIFEPSIQMHNRGNGKGGGIAVASLVPDDFGVDATILRNDYILQIALLDPAVVNRVEKDFICPHLKIDHREKLEPVADYRQLGLDVRPPDIVRYFVRVKEKELSRFAGKNNLMDAPARAVEDEFIYQNSFRLNQNCYASLGEKKAFILSHARNLIIFKIVGYAEQVVQYYGLEKLKANIWIAHQRYPTKGMVWHPGGTHPFIGMNEALVHNGDFANYFSISQYLRQHNITSLYLTDTEVAVLLFDLWHRIYRYPVEYVIEAMAPTTELDFDRLPDEKKRIYRSIQAMHMHGSPDGPWFFIIAHSSPDENKFHLIGITDTAMLRPQVFALQEGDASIGLIASEKQAIDATLHSLAAEDSRFRLIADRYWNARGGSHVDGGAFIFTVEGQNGQMSLSCTDKFGMPVTAPEGSWDVDVNTDTDDSGSKLDALIDASLADGDCQRLFERVSTSLCTWDFSDARRLLKKIEDIARKGHCGFEWAMEMLALLNDRRYDCGKIKRSVILQAVRQSISTVLDSVPNISVATKSTVRRIDWSTRDKLRPPEKEENVLVVSAAKFPPEGRDCDARLVVSACQLGWRRFIVYGLKGQRFTGCGLGPETDGVRIDVFGSSGDYLASGIDGSEIHVHGTAQDQVAQIMKTGTLIIHGDVGQAFMYGAKGGTVFVLGNAAGRPLINAVGGPKVVINGTCLDFLAESFMAGDPYKDGGFVILNGLRFDDRANLCELNTPYPGANLFSLASGGAIFVRDPHNKLVPEQLNGGQFAEFTEQDWELILPYLQENERFFGISIERDLLTVDGVRKSPQQVYRKVRAVKLAVLAKEAVPE